jgi:hypothetical protein
MLELEKHLTCLGNQQHAFVFSIREFLGANALRIAIAQIDPAAGRFRNGRGQCDLHAASFDAVLECADAADVGRMREHAPGILFEPVPLLQKIIAAMITDFRNQPAVRD